MKKRDLQSTNDNIRMTFVNDSIGRDKELVHLIMVCRVIN